MKKQNITTEWDKAFPKSGMVNHSKVTFVNRYGITLSADMYEPNNSEYAAGAVWRRTLQHLIPA